MFPVSNQEGSKKSYAKVLKTPAKKEISKKYGLISQDKNRNNLAPKRPNRYLQIFLGHFFACNNFGHKSLNCRTKRKVSEYKNKSSSNKSKGNKNLFTSLQKYDIECYKCNNHGHMARDCRLKTHTRNIVAIKPQNIKQEKYWKEKEEMESSMIALCATESQNL